VNEVVKSFSKFCKSTSVTEISESQLLSSLQEYWGYTEFRSPQLEVISSVLSGQDGVAILPTGAGKSLCYQLPAVVTEGMCLVISPLIALMEDQRRGLKSRGIKAASIHSGLGHKEIERILDYCSTGKVKLLYVSPERIRSEPFRERLKYMPVRFIAVDEAHCISQWGSDFRPAYRELNVLRRLLPGVPILALTASATKKVEADIIHALELRSAAVHRLSTYRPNLSYRVIHGEQKFARLAEMISQVKGGVIVYTQSRVSTEQIARGLRDRRIRASFYHAGVPYGTRKSLQSQFLNNKIQAMICTSAFGMGIDKPDVRLVAHWDMPLSIEEYYQEAGRAGRDGAPSDCVVLLKPSDVHTLLHRFDTQFPELATISHVRNQLLKYGDSHGMDEYGLISDFDYAEFAAFCDLGVRQIYFILQHLHRYEWIRISEDGLQTSLLRMLSNKEQLYEYTESVPESSELIKSILRSYEGVFFQSVRIDEAQLADRLELSEIEVRAQLEKLKLHGVIRYARKTTDSAVRLLARPEISPKTWHSYLALKQNKYDQFKYLMKYLETSACRSQQIGIYFGEVEAKTCGICDNCRRNSDEPIDASAILDRLQPGKLTLQQLLLSFDDHQKSTVLKLIEGLLEEELIKISSEFIFLASDR